MSKKTYKLANPDLVLQTRWGKIDSSTPSSVLSGILLAVPTLADVIVEENGEPEAPTVTVVTTGATKMVEPTEVTVTKRTRRTTKK
jgi:hypothetical protein